MFLVGIGPGLRDHRTIKAEAVIRRCEVVVGYTPYLKSINDLLGHQQLVTSGMRKETERCTEALFQASQGKRVALVSSGDVGIYGMAGLAMEIAASKSLEVEIEVIPGVTAAIVAASQLGAPLMLDFAVISLSDILVPWKTIERRLKSVAQADLVTCLYNPRSRSRHLPFTRSLAIFREYRPAHTVVGIARNAGKEAAVATLTTLGKINELQIDMHTTVIIGNSDGQILQGHWVTARGYAL